MPDFYEVLQVGRRAEHVVIRAAYRALARKYHPDFGGDQARMIALNEAWRVLGDHIRRTAYDASPEARSGIRREADPLRAGPATHHLPQRDAAPDQESGTGSGTVIDFGRYSGWTVADLANEDPDYLEWLARAPIGRRLATEIGSALAQRAAVAEGIRPTAAPTRRRRRWA
jgi:curved DNA-binding protein CbpA